MNSKMSKWERFQLNEKHLWRAGDLCTPTYNEIGGGIIYRVMEIKGANLKVKPVFGVIADAANHETKSLYKGLLVPLSLIDLATAYTKFGLFIGQEAKQRAEQETDAAEVPAGDAGDDEGRHDDADGGRLCADFAAHNEGTSHG